MPPWPKEQVSKSDPFQFVGLDYLGPVNVKCESQLKKTYIHLSFYMSLNKSNTLEMDIGFVSQPVSQLPKEICLSQG